jgi:hypothetical protein
MDALPLDILYTIARVDLEVFLLMARAIPVFARDVTERVGVQAAMLESFGYVCRVQAEGMFCRRYGVLEAPFGPALIPFVSFGCTAPEFLCGGVFNGGMYWFTQGVLHRDSGPAAIYSVKRIGLLGDYVELKYEWYHRGLLHRAGAPAVISGSTKQWYSQGKLHREDGPAIDAELQQEWYNKGVRTRGGVKWWARPLEKIGGCIGRFLWVVVPKWSRRDKCKLIRGIIWAAWISWVIAFGIASCPNLRVRYWQK